MHQNDGGGGRIRHLAAPSLNVSSCVTFMLGTPQAAFSHTFG